MAALELIDNIFEGCPAPLGEGMFGVVAEGLMQLLVGAEGGAGTEDRDMIQSGLNVVTSVVRKDVAQLLQWCVYILLDSSSCRR